MINTQTIEGWLTQANKAAQQGDWQAALDALQHIVDGGQADAGVYTGMGTCLIQLGDIADAIPCFKEAVRLAPQAVEVYNNLGMVYTISEQLDEAAVAYEAAVQLDPANTSGWKSLALVHLRRDRLADGVQILASLVKADPQDWEAMYLLAQCYEDGEDAASARTLYEQVLQLNPEFDDARDALKRLPATEPARVVRPEHAKKLAALKGLAQNRSGAAVPADASKAVANKAVVFYGTGEVSDGVRLLVPAQGLQAQGWRVKVTRTPEAADIAQFDVFVFSRVHLSPGLMEFMRLCKQAGKRVIFDLDDDFRNIPADHPGYAHVGPGNPGVLRQLDAALALADVLTVATPVLSERYGSQAKQVVVIPNGWSRGNPLWEKPSPPHRTVNIGWAGTATHRQDVALLRRDMVRVMRELPQAQLVIGGDYAVYEAFGAIPETRRLFLPMTTFEDYPFMLAHFDILLAPLRQNAFNQAKSDIKLLEAGIRRIPWVASPVQAYRDWGVGGVLAEKEGDWFSAVKKLVGDAALRKELGEAGWEKAQGRQMDAIATSWMENF